MDGKSSPGGLLFFGLRLWSGWAKRIAEADSFAVLRNDNKKTGNRKRRSPPGMTTRKATTRTDNGKSKRNGKSKCGGSSLRSE
jgi:hypothetical protein